MAFLPTKDELELAMFSLSHFGSELDSFESSVRSYANEDDAQPPDHDAAAHVLAFAVDARDCIAGALKDLDGLEQHALAVYHDAIDGESYWQRVTKGTIDDLSRLQQLAASA
jgi:hypothetical protein